MRKLDYTVSLNTVWKIVDLSPVRFDAMVKILVKEYPVEAMQLVAAIAAAQGDMAAQAEKAARCASR
jgi:hypothetical protein